MREEDDGDDQATGRQSGGEGLRRRGLQRGPGGVGRQESATGSGRRAPIQIQRGEGVRGVGNVGVGFRGRGG